MLVIPFPFPDESARIALPLGPIVIRWYALAYIAGIVLGWVFARALVRRDALWGERPRPSVADLDDLVTYVTLGIVLGGRIGFILFYKPLYYLENPLETVMIWRGGMAFHGGLIGVVAAVLIFSRVRKTSAIATFDVLAVVVPIGLLFGRVANFVNGELWGRPADVWWAMVFPEAGPEPRHPSQLYQAGLEGLLLFAVLIVAVRLGALRRPGLALGLFGIGYGLARIVGELFRQPDPQLGFLFGDVLTMGMLLSLPMVVLGAVIAARALALPAVLPGPA